MQIKLFNKLCVHYKFHLQWVKDIQRCDAIILADFMDQVDLFHFCVYIRLFANIEHDELKGRVSKWHFHDPILAINDSIGSC